MSGAGNAIKSLLLDNGQTGSDMTHGLKVAGNGDMKNGIKRVAAFFLEEGKQIGYKMGEKSGRIQGTLGTLAIGSAIAGSWCFVKRQNKKKKHEEEGKKIIGALQQNVMEEIQREEKNECI